jgi:hypothetical protein
MASWANRDIHFESIEEELQKPTDMRIYAISAPWMQDTDIDAFMNSPKLTNGFCKS